MSRFVNTEIVKGEKTVAEEIGGTLTEEIGNGLSGMTADREEDFVFDPEEAAICLTCPRARCLLDEDRPCLRYRRRIRALRAERMADRKRKKEAET